MPHMDGNYKAVITMDIFRTSFVGKMYDGWLEVWTYTVVQNVPGDYEISHHFKDTLHFCGRKKQGRILGIGK